MSRLHAVCAGLLVILVLASGCGSDGERASAQPGQTGTATQARDPVDDKEQIRRLANRYLKGVIRRDWGSLCATLSPSARARFEREGDGCEKAYRSTPRRASRFSRRLVPTVPINGERATIRMTLNGVTKPHYRLYAAKIDGRWWLLFNRAEGRAA